MVCCFFKMVNQVSGVSCKMRMRYKTKTFWRHFSNIQFDLVFYDLWWYHIISVSTIRFVVLMGYCPPAHFKPWKWVYVSFFFIFSGILTYFAVLRHQCLYNHYCFILMKPENFSPQVFLIEWILQTFLETFDILKSTLYESLLPSGSLSPRWYQTMPLCR